MSVLIKGMKMPVNCTLCFLKDSITMYCPYEVDKENLCPLVEVPTPHGRLIDADAHLSDMEHGLWDWESVNGIQTDTALRQSMTDIRNAPTVIEAEE